MAKSYNLPFFLYKDKNECFNSNVMGIFYYVFCASYLIVLFGIFNARKKRFESSLYVGLYLLLVIASLGNLFIAISTTLEQALLATEISYIGGIFLPFIMLMILSKFSKFKYHSILQAIGMALAIVHLGITIYGINFTNLYYTSVEFKQLDGVSYLVKEYGPLHLFSTIYAIVYIIGMIVFFVYSFLRMNTVSYKNALLLVVIVTITSTVRFFSHAFSPAIDLIPIAYCISSTLIYFFAQRTFRYNIESVTSINLENKEVYACMGFDSKLNYLGANKHAILMFPYVKKLEIDRPLPDLEEFKELRETLNHMQTHLTSHEYHIERGNRIYKVSVQVNVYKGEFLGYFVEATDDTKNVKYQNILRNYNKELEQEVRKQTEKNLEMQQKVLVNLADMISTRDESTGGHVKRTSHLVRILINYLKVDNIFHKDDYFYDVVRRSAPMHDLGKLTISEEILNKPGRFTPEEFEIMKTHSAIGEKYVEAICKGVEDETFIRIAKNVARHHHEKYEGGGYPDNLQGEDIPLEARIMAVADVYDALVSKRVYKEKMSFEKANDIMLESFGPHFDPRLKDAYLQAKPEWEAYYSELDA